jgi:RHS repeat-associated protein
MKAPTGVAPEVLTLPKGGGAVRSIGDSFAPDLYTGTGSYQIPLWFPKGPGGFQPSMSLIYTSGSGNGAFGMGWRLPLLEIRRRSDRGLPSYDDQDTFLLDGQEVVPTGGGMYRLRIEGEFRRAARTGAGWEITDRSGRRFALGQNPAARIEETSGSVTRTLAWLIESATDRNGNRVDYTYIRDQGRLYLDSIRYGPYQIQFLYEARPDTLIDRRPGFPIGTSLRAKSIEYLLPAEAAPRFRSYELTYTECSFARLSQLASVTFHGYLGTAGSPPDTSLPKLQFGYTPFEPKHLFQPIGSDTGEPPPGPLEEAGYDLVDMRADGLPGVIQVEGPVRRFWPNRGGEWGPPHSLRRLPANFDLTSRSTAFADMNGDGRADITLMGDSPIGYLQADPLDEWSSRVRFSRAPSFDPADPDVRLFDLNGDGLTDALRITTKAFYVFWNRGPAGWDAPFAIARQHDAAIFPDVSFRDARVKLADMTGDGLVDIVWVHGSRIDYWPNLGNGHFGARVSLSIHPSIVQRFDPARLFLADVNGDGVSDVVYEEGGRVRFWINQSGKALLDGGEALYTPRGDATNARVTDLLGTGTAGLVWSFAFSTRDPHNYKYLGFAGTVRPYLLNRIDNGIGAITEIEYRPSTRHAVEAASRGTPWKSALPFPVQTVSAITQHDTVSGAVTTRTMRYYDGHFDGEEREFRGFGRVEVIEHGRADSPSTMTVSSFHQGRSGITPGASAEERAALKGRLYKMEVFGPAPDGSFTIPFRREDDDYGVKQLALATNGKRVLFPKIKSATVLSHEGEAAALSDKTEVTYDDLGNITRKEQTWDAGGAQQKLISRYRYTADTVRWILNLPVELVETDGAGTLLRQHRYFYDGAAFTGLALGQVVNGNLSRREELVLTDAQATAIYGAALPNFLTLGYHHVPADGGGQGWAADSVRQSFDARGNIVAQQDAFGNTGRITMDANGIFPTSVSDPLGHVFDSTYDIRAQEIVRISDPNGHQTEYRFDSSRRLLRMFKPGDSDALPTVGFEYLHATQPAAIRTHIRDGAGTLDSTEYFDGFSKRIQLRSAAEGGQVLSDGSRRYNARGWEAARSVPRLTVGAAYVPGEGLGDAQLYHFRHDPLGRIIETTTPDGRVSRVVYELGRIRRFDVSDTDASPTNVANGHFDTPRIEEYDARGRLLAVTETNTGAVLLTTRYELDALGRIVSVTNPRGIKTASYTYDLVGRKVAVVHADAGKRLVTYDARGDLVSRVDAKGQVVSFAFDELRRTTIVRDNGVIVERYTYDAGAGNNLVGRLAKVEDEAGEVHFSYTARGQVEQKTRAANTLAGLADFTLTFTYDSMERQTSVARPDGSIVNYTFNGRSLPDSIPGIVNQFRWNARGQVIEAQFANGVTEQYDFDPATFYMTGARTTGPASPQPYYDVTYAHDAAGNPLSITDNVTTAGHHVFSRTFRYDAVNQLTRVDAMLDGAALSRTYQYDASGNFSRNDESGMASIFLEPGGNRISGNAGVPLFGYDQNGYMVSVPHQNRTFDSRGRLIEVQKDDGTIVRFTYGYSGERVRKQVITGEGTSESIYIDNVFELRDGVARRYTLHQSRRVAEESGGQTVFLHPDHLGNIVLITNSAGAIVKETGYLPFGTVAFTTGASQSDHALLSREFDQEIGLVFCASRYYDPALGRFISPDPFLLLNPEKALATPLGLNLYVYAGNNPVRHVDDNGTWWKWLLGALIIAALVVATIVVGVFTGGAGFAFGILLAASIGSALGAGVGTFAAWSAHGNLEDGFLLGAIVGGAAGAAGFAAGAAVGAAGISGVWGSILAGAAEGAVVGAGNGAIIGYGGGKGSAEDILKQMAIGFLVGAVLGGLAGWVKYDPNAIKSAITDAASTGTAQGVDPATGAPLFQSYSTGPVMHSIGQGVGNVVQQIASATAYPVLYAGIGAFGESALWYHWDDIKAWILETFGGDDKTVTVPVYSS